MKATAKLNNNVIFRQDSRISGQSGQYSKFKDISGHNLVFQEFQDDFEPSILPARVITVTIS